MCYGERIKTYLDENGIKYISVSAKINIPMNTFSTMLNGKRKISIGEYFTICDALGLPYDFFADEKKSA